jgi:hypothetical protein
MIIHLGYVWLLPDVGTRSRSRKSWTSLSQLGCNGVADEGPLQPFCRVAGHKSCEVREVLATLETVFQPLLPQINLRRWTGSIYDWLTQSALDPTNSGRVTMDNLSELRACRSGMVI